MLYSDSPIACVRAKVMHRGQTPFTAIMRESYPSSRRVKTSPSGWNYQMGGSQPEGLSNLLYLADERNLRLVIYIEFPIFNDPELDVFIIQRLNPNTELNIDALNKWDWYRYSLAKQYEREHHKSILIRQLRKSVFLPLVRTLNGIEIDLGFAMIHADLSSDPVQIEGLDASGCKLPVIVLPREH